MHGLEAKYSGQVTFVYLDTDDHRTDAFKSQLGYIVQPHLFLLDGSGQVLEQWLGYVDGAVLEEAIGTTIP